MPVWLSYPSSRIKSKEAATAKHCLLFFIPGNPGFIDYYDVFFAELRKLLDRTEEQQEQQESSRVCFTLLGRNLLGFDDDDDGDGAYGADGNGLFGLDAQISAMRDAIAAARIDSGGGARHGEPFDAVFVAGHSVGSYIALEVFRQHQEARRRSSSPETDLSQVRLRAGFLLFATVTDIARSPNGRKLEWLLATPLIGSRAPGIAEAFLSCMPSRLLSLFVHHVLGFPPPAAAVTTRFLNSQGGVRQALYLGGDEMATIRDEKWADEVWEVVDDDEKEKSATGKVPKFFILFGQNDEWVSNECRDRFIARRAENGGRTRIVMDERGLPHAFCIDHSEEVAEVVNKWISETIESF